jgi:hypothetical protein
MEAVMTGKWLILAILVGAIGLDFALGYILGLLDVEL